MENNIQLVHHRSGRGAQAHTCIMHTYFQIISRQFDGKEMFCTPSKRNTMDH